MSNILVTGGAGFIGSHVTEELVNQGHQVTVLDDLSGGFIDNVVARAEFVQGSIDDVPLIQGLFEERKFEYVFYLAAYAAEGLSHFIKRFNYESNLIGSIDPINHQVAHFWIIIFPRFLSSGSIFDRQTDHFSIDKHTYGIAKLAVDQELGVCKEMFDLDYIIFWPHNVYGERQNIGDKYCNVVGIFMNQILQDRLMTVFGDGNQTRAFSYIGDVAPNIAKSAKVPEAHNQVFNIGAD